MAYSTGSGNYTALMAAVLAHALADGWTETGGVGTGWPIAKGAVRGVDWTTTTAVEDNVTEGFAGVSSTQRYLRLGIGSSGANATLNRSTGPTVANMAYSFTSWHIFSDTSVSDHIHVVAQFNNGVSSECFTHFSFGELDKNGLTYGSVAYVTGTNRRAYAVSDSGGTALQTTSQLQNLGSDWNTLNRCPWPWAGDFGETDAGSANTSFMINGTDAPTPNGVGGYPAWDTIVNAGSNLWAKNVRHDGERLHNYTPDRNAALCHPAFTESVNGAVGQTTLLPIPFVVMNGNTASSRSRYLGTYPNVRACNVLNVAPATEFTFGTEVWMFFPMTRATSQDSLNVKFKVTSGLVGFAYKKVV